jgi:type IV pilus assembly protein PilM
MKTTNIVSISPVVYKLDNESHLFVEAKEHFVAVGSSSEDGTELHLNKAEVVKERDLVKFLRDFKEAKRVGVMTPESIFNRYIALPPVSDKHLNKIIYFEAQQNVPFPMNEIVWGYEILKKESPSIKICISSAKKDLVKTTFPVRLDKVLDPISSLEKLYGGLADSGKEYQLILFGDRGLCSVFITNKSLDFSRCIPIGKYVNENGAPKLMYDSPELTRNTIVRIHAELVRTLNFYRSQIGGDVPSYVWTPDSKFAEAFQEKGRHLSLNGIVTKGYKEAFDSFPTKLTDDEMTSFVYAAAGIAGYESAIQLKVRKLGTK